MKRRKSKPAKPHEMCTISRGKPDEAKGDIVDAKDIGPDHLAKEALQKTGERKLTQPEIDELVARLLRQRGTKDEG